MRMLRLLLTLWLCVSLPYAALASSLRDPHCTQGAAAAGAANEPHPQHPHAHLAMQAMPGMPVDHEMASMSKPETAASAPAKPRCGCLLACACITACGAPACNSGLQAVTGLALSHLKQEMPAATAPGDRRPSLPAEVFRPPARDA